MGEGGVDPGDSDVDSESAVETDGDSTIETDTTTDTETPTGEVPTPTGDVDTVPLAGMCDPENDYGGFLVETLFGFSIVDGTVSDGVVPVTVLEPMLVVGECELKRRNNPFCDPPCQAGETCTFDGECITFPRAQDLGTVTVGGLSAPVSMEPLVPGFNYSNTSLPHPGFAAGDLIELRTGSGAYPDLELHGVGVTPLESDTPAVLIVPGEDLTVTWTPPPDGARSRVVMQLTIDQHGLTPVKLLCDFEDDGSGVVGGSLLQALVDFGVTGFPNGTMKRQTADHVAVGDGCMDFVVSSPLEVDVDVDGFTPCRRDDECPEGQQCDSINEICY
jgi:hypothetical protein